MKYTLYYSVTVPVD